jgi:hypothetical protein
VITELEPRPVSGDRRPFGTPADEARVERTTAALEANVDEVLGF